MYRKRVPDNEYAENIRSLLASNTGKEAKITVSTHDKSRYRTFEGKIIRPTTENALLKISHYDAKTGKTKEELYPLKLLDVHYIGVGDDSYWPVRDERKLKRG